MRDSLKEMLGNVMVIGIPGKKLDNETCELIKKGVGGIILFSKNMESPGQTRALISEIQEIGGELPLFIAVDQEGGMTAQVYFSKTISPGNMAIGATGNEEFARQASRLSGIELRDLGFNTVLAPVLDINNNPDNPVIGTRSFGGDPALVSRLGIAAIRGYRDSGILPCAKHFPGHGDTSVDSH
ncbi:MAG: glycoside hydrolase family 3 protein, partial [Candidatus Eremiobacteraeota bacterium]|nr:glycoside hydrolase family 3 protein [Candidatus Eremiobacteraeota bacterium]